MAAPDGGRSSAHFFAVPYSFLSISIIMLMLSGEVAYGKREGRMTDNYP